MLILFTYTNKKIPVKYYFTGIYLLIEAERQGYEPTPPYLSNSMCYQYVKALGVQLRLQE